LPSWQEDGFLKIFILLLLHVLTCVYIIWPTSLPPAPGRTCSALWFSDFVEEKTYKIKRKT
jgi:hypothetical protein